MCTRIEACYASYVRPSRRFISVAIVTAAAIASTKARAAEAKTSSLSWLRMPGAEGCVATQPLARAVEARLGHPVFVSAAEADLSIEGRIARGSSGGFHAVITLRDATGATLGTRELGRPDPSCETMTESLALVIAVMLDPEAATRPREPAALPEQVQEPVARPPPSSTPQAAPQPVPEVVPGPPSLPAPPDPWRFEGHLQTILNYGLAPMFAAGAGVDAILYPPTLPVGFRGYTTLFLPTNREQDGARASFDMIYAGGGVCPTLRGRVNLLGCVGGHLGVLRPRAETSNRGIREDLLPILDAMIELRVHAPLIAPIGAAAGIGAGLPILRPELRYRPTGGGTGVLHQPEAYVLTADLGIGFVFP